MNPRLTWIAALAVFLSSFSLLTVITGIGWLYAGLGAVVVVACAGLVTRSGPIPAAVVAAVLTLIAVGPLLAGPGWSRRIIALVIVAVVAASAGVRRILPAVASLVTYLAAMLLYLNLVFARALSTAWIVPTASSLHHLTRLASDGYQLHNYAPPVPSIAGIELISAAGIGAVAIITDLIAVRLRSPAVAGLPLLVLFSVPVATNVKNATVGLTLAFCLGITGYLAMLATDGRQRLRLWGRLVTVWEDTPDEEGKGPDTRQLAASGRRVGLTAVAFAIVIPLILPGLREHGIFARSTTPGHGTTSADTVSPIAEMRSQLDSRSAVPVLTYRTTASNPPQQYLQVYVLSILDGATQKFTLPEHSPSTAVGSGPLQSPPGMSATASTLSSSTTITMSKTAKGYLSYLPTPYAPETVKLPGSSWYETKKTLMLWGYRQTAGLQYTVNSRTAEVFQNQLPTKYKVPASLQSYLTYDGPDKSELLAIARTETKHAHTMFAKALALQYWFTTTGGFTYSLHNAANNVVDFLTNDKYGFCQQYAFSMAVLARLLGIPSRIAVGYTAGTRVGHGVWKVTTADAHAWPELYFPTVGWTRFEPTPGGPEAQGTATRPNYPSVAPPIITPGGSTVAPTLPISSKGTNQGGPGNRINPHLGATGPGAGKHSGRGSGGFPIGLVVAIVAGVLLVAPGLTRSGTRRRRWLAAGGDLAAAHAAWRELTSTLTDYGLDGPTSESPRALARRVTETARLDEPARQALDRVASAEERARYARSPAAGGSLRADELAVRRAVARNATRWQRWRARLLPASTLDPVWAAMRQAPDVFGWLDAAALRMRRSVLGSRKVRRTA
jgi:transglutaminase-like putative cysteine protease